MKALNARQALLISKSELSPIPLLVLTTYTDIIAKTGASVHYFSNRSVSYDYGDTGTLRQFEPFLANIVDSGQEMPHLASPDAGAFIFNREVTIELRNGLRDSDTVTLFESLRAENLEGGEVEIAELLIDPTTEDYHDASQLTGDEHIVFYRGDIERIRGIGRTFFVDCSVPKLQYELEPIIINDDNGDIVIRIDINDIGKRMSRVYGFIHNARLRGILVSGLSQLTEPMTDTGTSAIMQENAHFNFFGGVVRIGLERMSFTGLGLNSVSGLVRGISGTVATAHDAGSMVEEERGNEWGLVAHLAGFLIFNPVARNPATGELHDITDFVTVVANRSAPGVLNVDYRGVVQNTGQQRALYDDLRSGVVVELSPDKQIIQIPMPATFPIIGGAMSGGLATHGVPVGVSNLDSLYDQDAGVRLDSTTGPPGSGAGAVTFFPADSGLDPDLIIFRWRIRVTANVFAGGNTVQDVEWESYFYDDPTGSGGPSSSTKIISILASAGDDIVNGVDISSWFTPTSDITLSDFLGIDHTTASTWMLPRVLHVIDDHGATPELSSNGGFIYWNSCILEVEVEQAATGGGNINTVGILNMGQGTEVFADIQGSSVLGNNYTIPSGSAASRPTDIVRHMLAERAGLGHDVIDDPGTWVDAEVEFDNANRQTALSFVESDLGDTLEQVIGRIGFETGTQIIRTEGNSGPIFKWLFASHDSSPRWEWPAPTVSITKWRNATEDTRDRSRVYTSWHAFFNLQRERVDRGDLPSSEDFLNAFYGDKNESNILQHSTSFFSNLEKLVGVVPHPPFAFLAYGEFSQFGVADTIDLVMDYYISESARIPAASISMIDVPWVESYAIELGDTVSIQLDWWPSPRKMRILGVRKNWDRGTTDLSAVEVL